MSQATLLTTGDDVLDRELADLRKLIDTASRRIDQIVAGTSGTSTTTTAPTTIVNNTTIQQNARFLSVSKWNIETATVLPSPGVRFLDSAKWDNG